jgi:hypothetical protein
MIHRNEYPDQRGAGRKIEKIGPNRSARGEKPEATGVGRFITCGQVQSLSKERDSATDSAAASRLRCQSLKPGRFVWGNGGAGHRWGAAGDYGAIPTTCWEKPGDAAQTDGMIRMGAPGTGNPVLQPEPIPFNRRRRRLAEPGSAAVAPRWASAAFGPGFRRTAAGWPGPWPIPDEQPSPHPQRRGSGANP